MQDAVQTIGAGVGTILAGVGVGDRRLRPHSHHHQQALKCPRCESLNTKFCYYNNYNLSQPRHFCKSCRRYWTKGGVLRNVPVGGGCRKAKRSSSANKAKKDQVDSTTTTTTATLNKSFSSNTEASAQDNTPSSVQDEAGLLAGTQDRRTMEGLACMMVASSEDMMGFSNDHVMNPATSSSYGEENVEFKGVDYGDSTLFDLTAAVDPNYWNDQPTSLNFLP